MTKVSTTTRCGCVLCCLILWIARPARALDTTEPFEPGVSDAEIYLGLDGLSRLGGAENFGGELVLGAGLTRRIAVTLAPSLTLAGLPVSGESGLGLGFYANVLDTDHVDLDLLAGVGFGGVMWRDVAFGPGLELNLEAGPDQTPVGFYTRISAELMPPTGGASGGAAALDTAVIIEPGLVFSVSQGVQLLAGIDMALLPAADATEPAVDVGLAALGANVALADSLELITQVGVDLPARGETAAVGLSVGLIATLPTRTSRSVTDNDEGEPGSPDRQDDESDVGTTDGS